MKLPQVKARLKFLAFSLFLSTCLNSCTEDQNQSDAGSENSPPNVVLVFADDMGYADLSSFGATDYETPHLDRMASNGSRFTSFYVSQPICTASRASLLTGAYANRIGLNGALGPSAPIGINTNETTLGELFKRNGYRTALFGKWHLGALPDFHPRLNGFDEFYGIPYSNDMWPFHPESPEAWPDLPLYENEEIVGYNSDQTRFTTDFTTRSLEFIAQSVATETPFFLYLPHPMPHVPLFVGEERQNASGAGLFADVIQEIDWSVGEILNSLEQHNIVDNTLVIFISDNGPWLSYGNHAGSAFPLREGKGTVFEGGVRVPFIAQWPAQIPAGLIVDTPAMTIDLFPTFAQLINDEQPGLTIDGKSIQGLLTGSSTAEVQDAYYFYYGRNELQAIRSSNWKLHFPHSYRTMNNQTNGADGIPGKYNNEVQTNLELYDLSSDISERINVAEQYPEVVERLTELANSKRQELGDALLDIAGTGSRAPGRITEN